MENIKDLTKPKTSKPPQDTKGNSPHDTPNPLDVPTADLQSTEFKSRASMLEEDGEDSELAAIKAAKLRGMHAKPEVLPSAIKAYTTKLPVYLIDQIKKQARKEGKTEKFILMRELNKSEFFSIQDQDLVEDLRKARRKQR